MNAYEELKAWCEKHLPSLAWTDTLADGRHNAAQDAIVIKDLIFIFDDDGAFDLFDWDN